MNFSRYTGLAPISIIPLHRGYCKGMIGVFCNVFAKAESMICFTRMDTSWLRPSVKSAEISYPSIN